MDLLSGYLSVAGEVEWYNKHGRLNVSNQYNQSSDNIFVLIAMNLTGQKFSIIGMWSVILVIITNE